MSVLGSAMQSTLTDVAMEWDVKVNGKAADILTIPSQLPPLFSGVFMTAFGLIQAGEWLFFNRCVSVMPKHVVGEFGG
ncbi:unnamed protein product [Hydatigera taeniaeformis]|uniref:HCO3_cotransp domain-containing protein n=1 Tax=Hydatigena taeniaeformis TaxID=6205 RepID=A0A0R3XDN7_HYDTA|nr:unnamed protein product [Hydatigera taeniaeformis]